MNAKEFKEKYLKKEAHNKFAVVQMLPKANKGEKDEELLNQNTSGCRL